MELKDACQEWIIKCLNTLAGNREAFLYLQNEGAIQKLAHALWQGNQNGIDQMRAAYLKLVYIYQSEIIESEYIKDLFQEPTGFSLDLVVSLGTVEQIGELRVHLARE